MQKYSKQRGFFSLFLYLLSNAKGFGGEGSNWGHDDTQVWREGKVHVQYIKILDMISRVSHLYK